VEFQSFVFKQILADFGSFGQIWAGLGKNCCIDGYHPYLLPQEVSKTPITLGTYGSLPKIRKGRFGSLSPLGLNVVLIILRFNINLVHLS
jgi:hypothetical protein